MTKGHLIVFEGLDKAGKETQGRMLESYINTKTRFKAEMFSFPVYNLGSGRLIRDYLDGRQSFSQKTINMIYSVNRYEWRSLMQKYLDGGYVVICDRYYYSNMAYGSFDGQTMQEIEENDSEMPRPDLTIFIEISPKTSLVRSGKSADRNERNLDFLTKVSKKYHRIYEHDSNWIAVNGEEDKQEVHEQIVAIVNDRLFKNDRRL